MNAPLVLYYRCFNNKTHKKAEPKKPAGRLGERYCRKGLLFMHASAVQTRRPVLGCPTRTCNICLTAGVEFAHWPECGPVPSPTRASLLAFLPVQPRL